MRRMRGFSRLTKVKDALNIVYECCSEKKLATETISISDACGRVLEVDIATKVDVPPFDRSAVDGYAIFSEEAFSASASNPAVLRLVGSSEAGGERGKVSKGECLEIFTGAQVPDGADAVVMAEDCTRNGDAVSVNRPVLKYANMSLRGEDLKSGEVVVKKGELLRPWDIGVLASIGSAEIAVRRKPLVGIISTGSELVDISEAYERKGTCILDSTRPMVISSLKELGCLVADNGIVKDNPEEIASKLNNLKGEVDLIITIGGTSVGGKDLVPEAVLLVSKEGLMFHGLAAKPGKPLGFGMIGETPFFMLPGYPVSALVGYETIIQPLLCRWLGITQPERKKVMAVMARRIPTTPGVQHMLRVMLNRKGDTLVATPIVITGSGLLSSITKADGIVIVNEDLDGVEEGDEVEVEVIRRWP